MMSSTAPMRFAVAAATGVYFWGMTFGDFAVGLIGVITLVVTSMLKLYVEFREEKRRQLSRDLEVSEDAWKTKYERVFEEVETTKTLIDIQREEIQILRRRLEELSG